MPVNKFSISLMPNTTLEIEGRGGERSTTINRSLERFFSILETSRRTLAEKFDKRECGLILDAMNGIVHADTISISLVYAEIEDSLDDGLDKKWRVDGKELVKKLRALTYSENAALVDAAERWWNRVGSGEPSDENELFKKRRKE